MDLMHLSYNNIPNSIQSDFAFCQLQTLKED